MAVDQHGMERSAGGVGAAPDEVPIVDLTEARRSRYPYGRISLGEPKTLLVVEDDRLSLKLYRDIFEAAGLTVIAADRAFSACAMARNQRPDIALVDVRLPDMSGFDLARWLKRETAPAPVPIVAVTATHRVDDESRARDAGCDVYLVKPVSLSVLLATVERVLQPGGLH